MLGFDSLGKTLMTLGILLLVIGALVSFGGKFLPLGRLPGDFHWNVITSAFISRQQRRL